MPPARRRWWRAAGPPEMVARLCLENCPRCSQLSRSLSTRTASLPTRTTASSSCSRERAISTCSCRETGTWLERSGLTGKAPGDLPAPACRGCCCAAGTSPSPRFPTRPSVVGSQRVHRLALSGYRDHRGTAPRHRSSGHHLCRRRAGWHLRVRCTYERACCRWSQRSGARRLRVLGARGGPNVLDCPRGSRQGSTQQ